jgi:hypothetical protein
MTKELNFEFDFEWVKGQWHYQQGGKLEDLTSPASRAGWHQEKYLHEQKNKQS